MLKPTTVTVKTLFARSCNRCAFPNCDQRLTDPAWRGVRADIAHIRGEKPEASRHAAEMTDEERRSIDNLMLLCPNHHREVDRLRPQDWSAERLTEVKLAHEADCARRTDWKPTDAELDDYAFLTLSLLDSPEAATSSTARPSLAIEPGRGDTFNVVNVSDADAYNVRVENVGGAAGVLRLEDEACERLSPRGRWRAGLYARTMGDGRDPVIRVVWQDAAGREYDAAFPL